MDTQHKLQQHNSTEAVQTVSLYRFEEPQKWPRSLTMQIPIIFDGRFKDSLANVSQAIKLMSKYFGGSRIWFELGTYIDQKGHLAFDLNVWVKSQMDEEKFSYYSPKVRDLACQIRDKLRQEAIVLETDGDMECL
ncbi:MAG: hypothetical protein WBL95_07710 [Microcoleus sp.]